MDSGARTRILEARDAREALVREWWRQLQRLQAVHVSRYEVSGYDALLAARRLRWDGDRLRGELLPADEPRRS